MAHPLNRPGYDPSRQRVCKGYGILQPRVSPSLPGASRSVYARLYSGDSGIDPYTRTVSDVYQDWFGEGSFIGKGIYDVDAFEQSLNGRFPENRILSHDLLEGCYARSGLLSDVEVFEDHPASYLTDLSRRHRWIRGDWQIASWLLPWVPVSDGRLQRNPLSALSLWKIADNLRRSLVPVALLLLLLAGWLTLPSPKLWTLVVVVVVFAPAFLGLMQQLFRKPPDSLLRLHVAVTLRSAVVRCAQAVACTRLPAARGVRQCRRSAAYDVAHARLPPTTARLEPVRCAVAGLRALAAGVVSGDVGCPGRCDGDHRRTGGVEAGDSAVGGTGTRAVVVGARHHLVAEPTAGAARAASQAQPGSLSPHAGAAHVGVLRDLRRTGGQLAASGQLPGAARTERRASHIADQHGPGVARQRDRLRLRLSDRRRTARAYVQRVSQHGVARAAPGSLLQLVRHADPAAAAANVRLDGRQRKSGELRADSACRPAGAAR